MKQCSVCKTTYTDDSLSFCLSDGTPLNISEGEQETVVRKIGTGVPKIEIPAGDETWLSTPKKTEPEGDSSTLLKIAVVAAVLIILAVAGLGLLGALFYFRPGMSDTTPSLPSPTAEPSASPSLDPEKRLREEIANIQRQLDEQKRNADPGDEEPEVDPDIPDTATVNSPNDGFLALRSLPDSERGVRLAKIPHGTELEMIDCEPITRSIAGRSGRWCLVEYNGSTGWVFDAWLVN